VKWGGEVKRKSQLESGELKGWFSARESEEQRPLRENTPAAMYEHVHGPVQCHSSYSEEIAAVNSRRRYNIW